ncbi:MAG TPA: MFS transporter [Solirubrobacterales bacterium]|nr:MFS transporter [Solirubrobacterales bacterium]
MTVRRSIGVFVLALAITGWNCGNVGPVVGPLTHDFDITLGEVGLLSGTFFFAGSAVGSLAGAALARRIRVLAGIWACCVLSVIGNVIFAVGDSFAVLAAGRVFAGVAFGLAAVFIPTYARVMGGVKMVGLFGAGLTLGVAASLFLGSIMEGAGVDWRVAFAITAALALISLPLLPNEPVEVQRASSEGEGLAREALTNQAWWRVQLLGIATLNLPLIVGAWLVHYLTTGYGLSTTAAGGFAFALFGISAVMRDVAGRITAAGAAPAMLVVVGLGIGAAGLVLLGQGSAPGVALVAIALMGVGLSLPYPLYYDEAERVLPDRPVGSLGLMQVGAGIFPIPVIPLFGAALASGDADLAFAALAGFALLTLLLNARPPVPPRNATADG